MKFSKLTKKLILSALSLGLAVVTLTTTTYAWYTTSTEASATGGKGTASGETSDTSLMISSDYGTELEDAEWGPTATISVEGENLVPVQWVPGVDGAAGSFTTYSDETSDDVYTFSLWFKTTGSAEAVAVYLEELTISNRADSLTEYPSLTPTSTTNGCPTSNYAVDIVRALDIVINNDAFDLSGLYDEEDYVDNVGDFVGGTPNAIAYYNEVMIEDLVGEDNVKDALDYSASITTIPGGVDQVVEVEFTIFLNGWDAYCFDACKGQSFDVSLKFSTTQPE